MPRLQRTNRISNHFFSVGNNAPAFKTFIRALIFRKLAFAVEYFFLLCMLCLLLDNALHV